MTINSFISVSLDPLLVLISLHSQSRTHSALLRDQRFSISLLSSADVEIAHAFSVPRAPFPGERIEEVAGGFLVIRNALATLLCEVAEFVEGGDHTLVLAHVLSFKSRDGEPLLFYRGEFGTLTRISNADELLETRQYAGPR